MKIYRGFRKKDDTVVLVEEPGADRGQHDGQPKVGPLDPAPSQALWNHSPTGFEWGYTGSGPAQLALAILLDASGQSNLAMKFHQEFKCAFVAKWEETWVINSDQIGIWLSGRAQAMKAACPHCGQVI